MVTAILNTDSSTWTDDEYRAQCDEVDAQLSKEFNGTFEEPHMPDSELMAFVLTQRTNECRYAKYEIKTLKKNKAWWQVLALSLAGLIVLLSAVMVLNSSVSTPSKSLTNLSSTPFTETLIAPVK